MKWFGQIWTAPGVFKRVGWRKRIFRGNFAKWKNYTIKR